MDEKELLLESIAQEQELEGNIDISKFLITILGIFVVLLILGPKVYLTNSIYYESRKFNELYTQYSILNEENMFLKQQLEEERFKNQLERNNTY